MPSRDEILKDIKSRTKEAFKGLNTSYDISPRFYKAASAMMLEYRKAVLEEAANVCDLADETSIRVLGNVHYAFGRKLGNSIRMLSGTEIS